jgi:glycosyltransferase involved in cell wall biosynthesis
VARFGPAEPATPAMRIALISIDYPPRSSSAAVQMRDLAREFLAQGHEPVVLMPMEGQDKPWITEMLDGVTVVRLAAMATRDLGYFRRTLGELLLPFFMLWDLRRSPLRAMHWDAVVWYSPSIFFGPLVRTLKRSSGCRSYLILRDIFPEWAVDLGLLRKGFAYHLLKLVARYQYSVADTIGVQSPSNLAYLRDWAARPGRKLEVLQNWLAPAPNTGSSISLADTPLAGRTIFVYAGNMGVAQGMDILLELATRLHSRQDIGFLFVGRGSDAARLRRTASERFLDNVLFRDEVDSREIPGLLAQCHVGIVALDPRHKSHNVPGKFLTYLQAGLPVLARINPGADLVGLIETEGVGRAYVGDRAEELQQHAEYLAGNPAMRSEMAARGRALSERLFSPASAVRQIVDALSAPEHKP